MTSPDVKPCKDGEDPGTLEETLHAELDLGALLFIAGAPGQRMIDSITFLNGKLHGGTLNILPGFESLVITLEKGNERKTAMREYPAPTAMDAAVLTRVSRYLRVLPEGADPSMVRQELAAVREHPPVPIIRVLVALTLFTATFGFFNHADAWALVVIAVAAALAGITRSLLTKAAFGYYMTILAATLVASVSAACLSQLVPTETPVVSLVIPCIFLFPGFQILDGGWEVLRNHLSIGIPRITVFLNAFVLISLGLLLVLLLYSPATDGPGIVLLPGQALVLDTILGGVAALCYCALVGAPRETYTVCFLCGAAGRCIDTVVILAGGNPALGVLCGTLAISVLSLAAYRRFGLPIVIPLVTASVQFIPGYHLITCLQGMAEIVLTGPAVTLAVVSATLYHGLLALFIASAIILGTLIPLLTLGKNEHWY